MRTNRFREAFRESANLAGLASAVAVSAALLTPIPLLLGAAAEVAYLLFVPDSRWYDVRLSRRFDSEVEAKRKALKDKIIPTLRRDVQDRFFRLEGVRGQITTQSQDEQQWFREVLRKLDYLLEKFLLFAGKEAQFRSYLQSLLQEVQNASQRPAVAVSDSMPPMSFASRSRDKERRSRFGDDPPHKRGRLELDISPLPEDSVESAPTETAMDADEKRVLEIVSAVQSCYAQDRTKVEELLAAEQDADTKAILAKRADVLQRRQEYVGKIGKILGNLNHQLKLVEETFGLINDEIRARSPEQILADIEEVVVATESMTETLEELAPYEQMTARLSE